ncbi:MAG: ABC transporter ATP-binding protein [Acidimicrobiales bacterium]
MSVIEVEGLTKRYGDVVAVDHVSLRVERGEIFGILGPNGAGKTTTVECLQGLRRYDSGQVRVLGLDPMARPRELLRRIGSQLQESALPDRMRVWEALDLFASVSPAGPDWRELLTTWGLSEVSRQSFASLSGGQRQRLLVALALVNDPEIVFLDELTQGLDPSARRVAWGLIRQVRDRGATVVLVTHHMDEVEQLCDRVAIIDRGRVIADGSPQQLVAEAAGRVTVRFSTDADVSWLADGQHVSGVITHGRSVEVTGSGPVLAIVASLLVERGIVPDDLRAQHPSLEDVYLELTGGPGGGP